MNDWYRQVAIVDYGLGNLYNVERACQRVGLPCRITASPDEVAYAAGVILPGVGAFGDAMMSLKKSGMANALCHVATADRPMLGICLGFQLMFAESLEFGTHQGLGIFDGLVHRLQVAGPLKVPQVGWNRLLMPSTVTWYGTVLEHVRPDAFMYFMHSYCVKTADRDLILAETAYGEEVFCSAARRNRITGVQFHPELSGPGGLAIYAQFASMVNVDMPIQAVTHTE